MKRKEALKICRGCDQFTSNKGPSIAGIKVGPDFHSCGKFLDPVEGISCGCIIELKTIFSNLTKCPQGKWKSKEQ